MLKNLIYRIVNLLNKITVDFFIHYISSQVLQKITLYQKCDFIEKIFTNKLMNPEFEKTLRENVAILHKFCRIYTDNSDEYEELFQEMMIQIWRSLEKFRGEAKVSTFVYRICINTALSFRAKLNRSKVKFESLDGKVFIQPEKDKVQDQQLEKLYAAIRQLKPIERAIIGLYLDEKSYREIAEILGISKTNVATRLMRLKKRIIERFNNE